MSNRFQVPPRPEVLQMFTKEAQSENPAIEKLAEILRTDVRLLGTLLQLVNSPYFGLSVRVTSARQSMLLLGLPRTLALVRAVALQSSVGDASYLPRFWDTATETGQICEKLAVRFTGVKREDAYTLGLFHDCGIPLMMQHYPEYAELLREANHTQQPLSWLESRRFGTNHCKIGRHLAEGWRLPGYISEAIELIPEYEDVLSGNIASNPKTLPLLALLCAAKHISNHFRKLWRVYDVAHRDAISPIVLSTLAISIEDFQDEQETIIREMSEGD